ncbi:MAG: hypothetical protein U0169_04050 [Polyangiaceae bacterium]
MPAFRAGDASDREKMAVMGADVFAARRSRSAQDTTRPFAVVPVQNGAKSRPQVEGASSTSVSRMPFLSTSMTDTFVAPPSLGSHRASSSRVKTMATRFASASTATTSSSVRMRWENSLWTVNGVVGDPNPTTNDPPSPTRTTPTSSPVVNAKGSGASSASFVAAKWWSTRGGSPPPDICTNGGLPSGCTSANTRFAPHATTKGSSNVGVRSSTATPAFQIFERIRAAPEGCDSLHATPSSSAQLGTSIANDSPRGSPFRETRTALASNLPPTFPCHTTSAASPTSYTRRSASAVHFTSSRTRVLATDLPDASNTTTATARSFADKPAATISPVFWWAAAMGKESPSRFWVAPERAASRETTGGPASVRGVVSFRAQVHPAIPEAATNDTATPTARSTRTTFASGGLDAGAIDAHQSAPRRSWQGFGGR